MVWLACCGVFSVVVSILIGVLNYSPEDSGVYRFLFDKELQNNKENFYFGCFCVTNKQDSSTLKIGDDQFCADNGCTSEIIVNSPLFYKDLILQGDVGIGESYFNEYWTYNHDKYDLADILTEFINGITNDTASNAFSLFSGRAIKYLIVEQWKQWYERKFTISKSIDEDKDSIHMHYDAGNDLYQSFMDETLVYSCAFFKSPDDSLKQAQINKIDLMMNKMNIQSGDNVLDTGSGWGYATYNVNKKRKCNMTGITVSEQQYAYQVEQYGEETETSPGAFRRYKLLDYRKTDELLYLNINKVFSVGIFEHIGIKNVNEFFNSWAILMDNTMKRELERKAKGGEWTKDDENKQYILGLHYITSADITPGKIDIRLQTACEQQTFIWKYIFPGGCLIAPDWATQVAKNYGFMLLHQEFFGFHYAKTLKLWRDNWVKNFDEFIKTYHRKHKKTMNPTKNKQLFLLYEVYFAFCEAMFRSNHIELVQQVFIRPTNYHDRHKDVRSAYTSFDTIYNDIVIPPRGD